MSRSTRSGGARAHPDLDAISPPRTPPGPSSYKIKKGRHPRPSVRETFLDDFGDNANDNYGSGDERDPHDLNLSPQHATRTSVVDNMLLSLDQFSSGTSVLDDYRLFNSAFESPKYSRPSQDSMAQRRYRGHTFSSSLSSEVEYGYDEGSSRYSSQHPRGRRSNSSSNYHSSMRRYESARSPDGAGSFGQTFDYRGSATAPGTRSGTRAGRKSSKGSSTSNLDFGPPLTRRQDDPIEERRSSSLDLGTRKEFMTFSGSSEFDSTAYDEMDAAPTPSIPAGPRKYQPPPQEYGSNLKSQSSRTPVASRRNSVKSSRTTQSRKPRPENLGTAAMRTRDQELAALADSEMEPPPNISASLDPPAPSPTISYNKPAFPIPPEPTPVKERPGFFRRVFGSSKNPGTLPTEGSPSERSLPSQTELKETAAGSPNVKDRNQAQKPNMNGTHMPREGAQVVNKKSSFFRRRKKSVAENIPPPITLPQSLGPKASILMKPEPSPVSSLRKVMNPYLADANHPNNSTLGVDYSTESSDWSTAANDPDNKKPDDVPIRKERGNSLNAHNGLKTKYSLYPASAASRAHDTSFLGASSGDEELSVKTNDKEATPPVPPRSSARPPKNFRGPEEREAKAVESKQVAETSRDMLTIETLRPTSLSPVAERSSFSTTVPAIQTPDEEVPPSTIKGSKDKGMGDTTIWNDDSDAPSKLSTPVITTESPQESVSEVSNYQTAANTPIVPQESERTSPENKADSSADASPEALSSEEKQQAQKLFDTQDEYVGNEPAAAWLGNPDRAKVRAAYMELFDWSNVNILAAMRGLCLKLLLKGETQQVDRVLDAFSTRWCQSNPRHGFKAADVVHTICYSLLLLNTDLHLADIDSKMTKAQFVRNTMPTIRRVAMDAAPNEFGNKTQASNLENGLPSSRSATFPTDEIEANTANTDKADKSTITPGKLVNRLSRTDLGAKMANDPDNDVGPLVSTPFYGTTKAWEQQLETVLREFYSSIQKERLPLLGAQPEKEVPRTASSAMLGPNAHGLRRSPSTVSKSGSDIYPRGRSADSRFGTARWSSKPRSRARLYPPSTLGSSRTSLDDQSSLWSPTGSSTWSKYSLGKLTSASVDSFASGYPPADYQQSIGFANALSQAIIREDSAHSIASTEDPERTGQLLEDETLELAGAPWAKEGSLKHKHHLDSVDKRAKDRNWNECFAVIQQGWMRLFAFNSSKTLKQKAKQRPPGGVVVGGGNWTENADEIWKFVLRQSIASALPPPGYSKSRPHVWALSLPTGAVHLFQAGTPEIVREFVSAANYWSARLSKEPLVGGISNIEYGWSDAVINSALINSDSNRSPPPSSGQGPRPSIQSSIRSSIDQQTVRPKLPADRVNISDWSPPQQSMMAANLTEADQLKSLQTYVKNVEDDLSRHNELRSAMVLAFSPRHPNGAKAMSNWERKSSYLLREIVKFRTYIDSLHNAIEAKNKIFADREPEENQEPEEKDETKPSES